MHRLNFPLTLAIVIITAGASRAAAQRLQLYEPDVPPFDISASVSMQAPDDVNLPPLCRSMGLPCGSPRTMPDVGLGLSVARNFTGYVGIVGEFSLYGNYWNQYEPTRISNACAGNAAPFDCTEVNRVIAVMAGPRIGTRFGRPLRNESAMRVFAQVLVGPEVSDSVAARRAIQPGGGVDIGNGIVAFRMQVDYRYTSGAGRNLSTSRVLFGIVVGAGE
jgi:hypothetical protein